MHHQCCGFKSQMMLDMLNVNVCCLYVSNQLRLGAATLLGS